ncbi:hypothetical protein HCG49_07385 [Arenibacter sp. 6A1]|uniref:EboA domain-containing protein n=1 Tax=Arenibacter sp. 6A1 TaxID=2720391 RepID=UPI00144651EA|nr:EboA domain-containing protein [Arenibacter sp. 6A1]NKI26383.1 hypothetical protein [Arenibacter sp. 6A1]
MLFKNVSEQLFKILEHNLAEEEKQWLLSKIIHILEAESTKDLYLTYSLIPSKIKLNELSITIGDAELSEYLRTQKATIHELGRIYLLVRVLEENATFFKTKVANIIQVADKSELETFLKFLVLLPNPSDYKNQAVEALRTNIATVFDAITMNNPYPALFFNDQQWNQMYLKAAFMQQDLKQILSVDQRANAELARIISDYGHERWAASREVDPYFWRPVGKFLDDGLLLDMERLLHSEKTAEKKAGALCCYVSDNARAKNMLAAFPELVKDIENGSLSWETLTAP